MREVSHWSAQSEAMLQDVLSDVDWDMFQESSVDDVSLFTEEVTDFIAKLIDDIVPMATMKVSLIRNSRLIELSTRL